MLPTHRSLTESAKRCLGKDLEVSDSEVDAAVEEGSRKLQFGPTELSLDDILSSPRPLRGFSAQVNTAAGRFAAEMAAMRKDVQQCMNAELLRELDAMKEKLSLQMKSQLAEQMVAVRKEFEGDMRRAVQVLESHLMRVEEDILETSRWESHARDPSCNSPEPTRRMRSILPSSPKLAKPSDEVAPRVVVDEERLRIKLDEIESTLDKHLESIELISKRLKTFASKAEVEALQSNVAAIEGSQAHRINELLSAISALREHTVAHLELRHCLLALRGDHCCVAREAPKNTIHHVDKVPNHWNIALARVQDLAELVKRALA